MSAVKRKEFISLCRGWHPCRYFKLRKALVIGHGRQNHGEDENEEEATDGAGEKVHVASTDASIEEHTVMVLFHYADIAIAAVSYYFPHSDILIAKLESLLALGAYPTFLLIHNFLR